MAGSSARRARRLNDADGKAPTEKAVEEKTGTPKSAGDRPDDPDVPASRRPLNRTAARRPTAARPTPVAPSAAASAPSGPQKAQGAQGAQRATADPPATPPPTRRSPLLAQVVSALNKGGDDPAQVASSLRMRGNETTLGYAVAAVLAVVSVVFLTVTTGKGAPAHPITLLPAIGLVLALAMAATVQLSNRILSAFLAVTSSLATTATQAPNSVRSLSTVDLLAALLFAVWITLRQSKARSVLLAERRKANQAARGGGSRSAGGRTAHGRPTGAAGERPGRRGRKAAEAEPAGPPPSARYTPPKKRS